MKIFFLITLLSLSACTTLHKEVYYTSHWREEWQNNILEKCSNESHLLTLRIADAKIASGYNVTEEYVVQVQKMLMDSCVSYYKIVI